MRAPARTWFALLALALTAAAAPPSAPAARWPGTRITYRDHSAFRVGVAEAVAQWNAAGTPLRLVPAPRGRPAQIDVYTPAFVDGLGRAFFPPDGRVFICRTCFHLPASRVDSRETPVIAHELGHALGIGHSRAACALMRGDGRVFARCAPRPGFYRCGPQLADVRALAHIYGVSYHPPPGLGLCPQ